MTDCSDSEYESDGSIAWEIESAKKRLANARKAIFRWEKMRANAEEMLQMHREEASEAEAFLEAAGVKSSDFWGDKFEDEVEYWKRREVVPEQFEGAYKRAQAILEQTRVCKYEKEPGSAKFKKGETSALSDRTNKSEMTGRGKKKELGSSVRLKERENVVEGCRLLEVNC